MTEPRINVLLGNQYHYNEKKGGFVHAKHERLAELVNEYDSDLDLVFIKTQVPPEPQYAVIQWVSADEYIVVSWWHEYELDDRIIVSIFENDFKKHNPNEVFDQMLARQAALKLVELKEQQEELAEKWEFGIWALRTPLNTFKHNGKTWRD